MFKFTVGEVVNHRSMYGKLLIVARMKLESSTEITETVYRCRNSSGYLQDLIEFELEKKEE